VTHLTAVVLCLNTIASCFSNQEEMWKMVRFPMSTSINTLVA